MWIACPIVAIALFGNQYTPAAIGLQLFFAEKKILRPDSVCIVALV